MATISSTFTDEGGTTPYTAAANDGNGQRADKFDEIPYEIKKINKAREMKKRRDSSTAEEVVEAKRGSSMTTWEKIKNFFKRKPNLDKADTGKTSIPSEEDLEAKARKKAIKRFEDLGIALLTETEDVKKAKYDRNFYATDRSADVEFMRLSKDPAMLFQFLLLKVYDSRMDNCEKAFRAWIEENEKTKILAKKRHELSLQNAEKTQSLTSFSHRSAWLKLGGCLASAIGGVTVAWLTASINLGMAAATAINQAAAALDKGLNIAADATNSNINGEIETNKADIEQLNSLAENSRTEASMIAQDLSRLQQDLSSINNIMQQNADNRKNALSGVRIG